MTSNEPPPGLTSHDYVSHNWQWFDIAITGSARKHAVSRARVEQALNRQHDSLTVETESTDPKIRFLGRDNRGVELELVAVVLPRMLLVIHAMPTYYRRSGQ